MVFEDLPVEDLVLLARHLSRVSGSISLKTMAEYFPSISLDTSWHILKSLLDSEHVQRGKHGSCTFVDPTGGLETGDLEEELRVLANFKKKVIELNVAEASSNFILPQSWKEKTESDEESTSCRKSNVSGVKSSRERHETTFGHGKSSKRRSCSFSTILENPFNMDKLRKLSLDETLFSSEHLRGFHHSTPENRKFKHLSSSPKTMARRKSSIERRRTSNSDSDEDSNDSARSPPPELNKTIYPRGESPTFELALSSCDQAPRETAKQIDRTETTAQEESAFLTAIGGESPSCGLESGMAALALDTSGDVLPAAIPPSKLEVPDLAHAAEPPTRAANEDAKNESASEAIRLEVNGPNSTSREVPSEAPQNADQCHRTREKTEDQVEDPCKALDVFCRSLHLAPPAYNLTYMPMDRVYYSVVLVGDTSFISYPTPSITERRAKELVAEKAVKRFGITAGMVATGVFPNPRRKIQKERSDSETHASHAEP